MTTWNLPPSQASTTYQKKQNEAGFGSFIRYDGMLYIFQFTVFDEHSIDNGLISRFAECTGLPQRDNWRYIFVIPDGVEHLKCPYPTSRELHELIPYSAQMVMGAK